MDGKALASIIKEDDGCRFLNHTYYDVNVNKLDDVEKTMYWEEGVNYIFIDKFKPDPKLKYSESGNKLFRTFMSSKLKDAPWPTMAYIPVYEEIRTDITYVAESYIGSDGETWWRYKVIHIDEEAPCYPENPNSNVLKDPFGRKHLIEWKDGIEYVDGIPISFYNKIDKRMQYNLQAVLRSEFGLYYVLCRLPPLKYAKYTEDKNELIRQVKKDFKYNLKSDGSFYTLYRNFNPKRALHQFKVQRSVSELIPGEDAMYEDLVRARDEALKEKELADLNWKIIEDAEEIWDMPHNSPHNVHIAWRCGDSAVSEYYYNFVYASVAGRYWIKKLDADLKYTYYEYKCRETLAPQEEKLELADQLTEKDKKRPKGCYSMDEITENELKFAKEYVAYEEELKEIKARFKGIKEEYAALGVNTRAVIKSIKKVAKSFKLSKTDHDDEERIEGFIRGNNELFSYIERVMV